VSHLESKIAVLENMLKGIVSPNSPDILDFFAVLFSLSGLRSFIECLSLLCSQLATEQKQASMTSERPKNDRFSP